VNTKENTMTLNIQELRRLLAAYADAPNRGYRVVVEHNLCNELLRSAVDLLDAAGERDALRTRLHEIHDAWCSLDEDRLDHPLLCGAEDIPIRPCDCGLDRLKAAIRAAREATP
jgi:hypothetical protein